MFHEALQSLPEIAQSGSAPSVDLRSPVWSARLVARYCDAMSQENVDAVREEFERFSRGDFSRIAGLPDDVEVVTSREMPDAGTYRGQEAREWMSGWVDSFDSLTLAPTEFLEAGDQVMVEFVQRGIPRGGNTPVELRTWSLTTLREGLVTRYQLFQTREEALEAAGLQE